MAKKALVISGGGSKGAFAVGVIKHLSENFPEIDFDIFVGTSTGSLIVPLAASGQVELLQQLYTSVTTDDVVIKGNVIERFLHSDALFDTQPLANLIKQYINDANCNSLFAGNKEVFIVTTCLQTCETVVWSTKAPPAATEYTIKKLNQPKELRRAVLASANQPVFMGPVQVLDNANPIRQYVDGGVREYLGLQIAVDAGADEIFAISLAPPQREESPGAFTTTYPILARTIDIFSQDVGWNDLKIPRLYNEALRYISAVRQKMKDAGITQQQIEAFFNVPLYPAFSGKNPLKIHHIFPDQPLGGGPGGLEFDPQKMTAMMQTGEMRLQNYMAGLPGKPDGNV